MKKDFYQFNMATFFTLLFLIIVLLMLAYHTDFVRDYRLRSKAKELVVIIETYKQDNNRLPESLDDLPGCSEESAESDGADAVLYNKISDSTYVIYYAKSFDENWYYYSDTQQWGN